MTRAAVTRADWADVSSYSRGERGTRDPSAWEWRGRHGLRVTVHRLHGIEGLWFASCHDIRLERAQMEAMDVLAAQAEALRLVKGKVALMMSDLVEAKP